jgi:ferredoxin
MKLALVYFSPTNTTYKAARALAEDLAQEIVEYNLTDPDSERTDATFSERDFVIFASPVFYGRIPPTALERFSKLSGDNTPAALVVAFGHRAYDDAVLELKNAIQKRGFNMLGAVALGMANSIAPKAIGIKRPDGDDMATAREFTHKLATKLAGYKSHQHEDVFVKGEFPYCNRMKAPLYPKRTKNCTQCGTCAKHCPTKAIDDNFHRRTDNKRCITCMRCTYICPHGARDISVFMRFIAVFLIKREYKIYSNTEFFI